MYDRYRPEMMMQKSGVSEEQFVEKEFFEYHIYDLQRLTTLANNETKQISLFEASNVSANKKFFYRSGLNHHKRCTTQYTRFGTCTTGKQNRIRIKTP